MNWFGWLLTVITVIGMVYYVARIGEPRDPITRADAAVQIIVNALLIWGYVVFL